MGRRGRGPQDRGIEGSLVERTWARRARSGIRVRKTQEPGQALPGLWGALRKLWPRRRRVPRFKALPASGRGRGAHLRPPWEPPPPPPPPASHRNGGPRRPWVLSPPLAFPGHWAPLFQAGGQRCLLVGRGGRGTSSTLTAEVIFQAPGSGLARHSLHLPRLPEPLSFCFFPFWGAFVSSRPELTRGAALAFWLPELHPVPAAAAG